MKLKTMVLGGVALLAGGRYGCHKLTQEKHECVTVTKTFNKYVSGVGDNDGHDEFRVFVTDKDGNKEEFKNVDAWALFKFNSSHLQNQMDTDQKLDIETDGIRFPLLSWYPNVTSVTVSPCNPPKSDSAVVPALKK